MKIILEQFFSARKPYESEAGGSDTLNFSFQ